MKELKEIRNLILEFPEIKKTKGEAECFNQLNSRIETFAENRKNFSKEQDNKIINLFRGELLDVVFHSDFCKYSYEKPRGYAGDFYTQEYIWMGRTDMNHRYLGDNESGKILTAITYDMAVCRANIDRMQFVKDQINSSGKRIASVGCGSGIEYWNAKNELPHGIDVFLLDQDSGALQSAQNHFHSNGNQYTFHQENIIRFIMSKDRIQTMGQRDLIYSVGMLDYFDVKSSSRIVSNLWNNIAAGGKIIITNAHPDNPTRTWMEYGGDWFLSYKDKAQMYQIIEGINDVADVKYVMDEYGVYQYLIVTKK